MTAARDWLHERRLHVINRVCQSAFAAGDRLTTERVWADLRAAIAKRSAAQVRRMEQRMGVG